MERQKSSDPFTSENTCGTNHTLVLLYCREASVGYVRMLVMMAVNCQEVVVV